MRNTYTALFIASLIFVLGSSGVNFAVAEAAPSLPSEIIIFEEDFKDSEVGEPPKGWTTNEINETHGAVQVVSDGEIESRRAVGIITVPSQEKGFVTIYGPAWGAEARDATTVAIDYKVKWIQGSAGMYNYFRKAGGYRMILLPASGELLWHASFQGMSRQSVGATFHPGWNQVRVIADRATQTASLYLNDMENPLAENLPFQRPVDTWEGMQVILTNETHASDTREVYYADFRVWVVE